MDNDRISIRQGARVDLQVEREDDEAVSVTLLLRDGDIVYEFTELYVDGIANFEDREDISTLDVGIYNYQLNENFPTGQPDIYPDTSNCTDCELPEFEICESIEGITS